MEIDIETRCRASQATHPTNAFCSEAEGRQTTEEHGAIRGHPALDQSVGKFRRYGPEEGWVTSI